MAAPKYIKRDATSGKLTEVIASESSGSEVIVSTTSGGTIDPSLLPASGAATATAGEALAAGDFIYIKTSDSKAYKAVWSTGGNQAIAYVLTSYLISATATYYEGGQNTGLTSLTSGARYYGDSTTPGAVTTVVPTGAGVLAQLVGTAVTTAAIEVNIEDSVVLAS